MSGKLKIYACSGIGTTDPEQPFTYFTDGTSTVSNTQAVNTLLARINSLYIEATMLNGISKEDRLDLLCDVDVYSVALEAVKQYASNEDKIYRAGQVIDLMIHDGLFEYDEMDGDKRDEHLEELIGKFNELLNDGQPIQYANADFMNWWIKNIIGRNHVGLDKKEQDETKKILKKAAGQISGIGKIDPNWKYDPNIGNYLLNAGEYFLYRYLSDAQLAKLPAIFRYKKQTQNRIYNYCKAYFVGIYGSEAEMQSVIRSGIIKEFKNTPEQICATIVNTGKEPEKVGSVTVAAVLGAAEIVKIISICAAVVIAIVVAICDCIHKSNTAKYAAIDKSIVDGGVPDETDYEGMGLGGGKKKESSAGKILAIFGGLLLFLNN